MPKTQKKNSSALILLSGGQDSATCLAWALNKFTRVSAICFDYGQRHRIELSCAKLIAKATKTPLYIQKIALLSDLTNSALTNDKKRMTEGNEKSLPSTFVPGRNLIFLSTAAIYATKLGITDIVTGVCQTDYSGYPDCRQNFINSLEKTLNLAIEKPFKLHTPLMKLTKAETVKLMLKIKQTPLLKLSHTCYKGTRPACGKCPSCKLRLKGFKEAGIPDPIKYEN